MSPAVTSGQPLQYFIHFDYDALRMEISGSLAGRSVQKAYEALRSASFLAGRRPLVVDISYVTETDEQGKAVLRAWQGQDAKIVASSVASRAIADFILSAPVPRALPRHAALDRLRSLLFRSTARNPARAEARRIVSAGVRQKSVENAGVLTRGEME